MVHLEETLILSDAVVTRKHSRIRQERHLKNLVYKSEVAEKSRSFLIVFSGGKEGVYHIFYGYFAICPILAIEERCCVQSAVSDPKYTLECF